MEVASIHLFYVLPSLPVGSQAGTARQQASVADIRPMRNNRVMRRALPLIAAVGLFPSLQAVAVEQEHLARLYSCEVFGGDGKLFDKFGVAIRPQARGGFEYEVEILSARSGSGKFPASAKALASGEFEIVSRAMGPNGEPPNAFSPRTGVKLVFEGSHPGNNGYAVIYRDGPSSNFEVAGYHPVAAGICTPGGKPGA